MYDDLTPHVHCPYCDADHNWTALCDGDALQGNIVCEECGEEFHWDAEITITATKELD